MPAIMVAGVPIAGLEMWLLSATKPRLNGTPAGINELLNECAVEEADSAGINELIITKSNTLAIEFHFDQNFDLEPELTNKNKLELHKHITERATFQANSIYIRQPEAIGCLRRIMLGGR